MSALTSLLVRDQVVPVRKIEEALQRQVISGGELETVLLELGAVPEDVLSSYRAAAFGLLAARREDVMRAPEEVVRLVPRELAQKHQVMPFAMEGPTLLLAVASPLTPDLAKELGRTLGVDVDTRIVNEVRISAALADHYGVAPIPRMQRLAERLLGQPAGELPAIAPESQRPPPPQRASQPPVSLGMPFVKPSEELIKRRSNRPPASAAQMPPVKARSLADLEERVNQAMRAMEEASARVSMAPRNSFVSLPIESIRPSGVLRKLRGPVSLDTAFELLQISISRDEILAVLFTFARQFFDYSALFVATEDAAEGRDAHGAGANQHDVQRIAIPFAGENAFAHVRRINKARVAAMNALPEDRAIAEKLGRRHDIPSAVIPISIRKRVVLLCYGDRGGESFSLSDIEEISVLAPKVGEAFERLIRERKAQAHLISQQDVARTPMVAAPSTTPLTPAHSALRPPSVPPVPSVSRGPSSIPASSRVASVPPSTMTVRPASEPPLAMTVRPASEPPVASPSIPTVAERMRGGGNLTPISTPRANSPSKPPMPSESLIPAREKRALSGALSVLSVPRSAPPPPMPPRVADAPTVVPTGDMETLESVPRLPEARVPENIEIAASSAEPRVPMPSTPPPVNLSGRPPMDGTYRSTDVKADVIPSVRPPAMTLAAASEAPAVVVQRAVRISVPPDRSVIVDMGDQVEELVRSLQASDAADEDHIIESLVEMGEAALPSLVQRFPGQLRFNRHQPHSRLPRGREVSAIAKAIVAFRSLAVPYMSTLLDSSDADSRFYATLLCTEMVEEALLDKLRPRLFDSDVGVRSLAIDVIRLFQRFPSFHRVIDMLRSAARIPGKDPHVRYVGARALGELRDAASVSLLISLLDDQDKQLVQECERSLSIITRQTLGDSRRRWDAWAEKNIVRHRIEWLIDALMHNDEAVRSAAGDELKRITQEYYGYHPSASKKDRERVQRRYQTWWETEGVRRFPH